MKIKLGAVIPTVQYGNLQPEFEVEADDPVVAVASLEELIQNLWDKYGEKPLVTKSGDRKLMKAFVGGEVYYDSLSHTYTNEAGEVYLSGSQYAKGKQKPFDIALMSAKVADKYKVDPKQIANIWERGGKVSREFGSTIHEALEVYGKYKSLSASVEKEYHLPNHPLLKNVVQGFYEGRGEEKAEHEVLVVDHKAKRAGCIDRLLITGPKKCIIQDFKITHKEDIEYWTDQLTFYQGILEAGGWTVEKKEIYQYSEGWKKHDIL